MTHVDEERETRVAATARSRRDGRAAGTLEPEEAAPPVVDVERRNGVAILTIDNPPVNTLSADVRARLIEELDAAETDPRVTAVVIHGAHGIFSAGADLGEFDSGRGLAEPSLHKTILDHLDAMSTPVVAAIAGAALGGGLELALGCHYRVVAADAKLGLPESTFGFIPGAGGTQRLPRAVGLERGVNLILSGRTVAASEVAHTRLIDAIVEDDPLPAAVQLAAERAGTAPPRLRDLDVEHPHLEAYLAFAQRAVRSARSAPAGASAALSAVAAGASRGRFDEGLQEEFHSFTSLAASPGARAARYRFFAERDAGRVDTVSAPAVVHSAAVIGAGTMGSGIALALLSADVPVTLIDADTAALDRAVARIAGELRKARERGRADDEQTARREGLLRVSDDVGRAGEADLIVEAVFESLPVKQSVFAELDRVAKSGAVLATNTSSLDVDAIAAVTTRPEDVVGLHFFSPAHVMRLLEVVRADRTSDRTLATALRVARRLKKVAVVARVGDGFIGNRLIDEYTRQACQLLLEGASPQQVDRALEAWGVRMGPFAVLDLVGNDIPAQARAARHLPPTPESELADAVAARGWLGRKAGSGWYGYPDARGPVPSAEVDALLAERRAAGPPPRGITDEEIVQRCVFALVNEAAAVLTEGIASRGSDVDVVMLNGYGFLPETGGPLFSADQWGLKNVVRIMRRFRDTLPLSPEAWEPHPLLVHLAASDQPISQWRNPNA